MYTEVKLKNLMLLADELLQCEMRLRQSQRQIDEVKNSIKRMDDDAMEIVIVKLTKRSERLRRDREKVKMLGVALKKICTLYENTEEKISGLYEIAKFEQIPVIRTIDLLYTTQTLKDLNLNFKMDSSSE